MANPLSGFWSQLTPRERTYIMVLVLVAFLMGTLFLVYLRMNAISKSEADVEQVRLALQNVYTRGSVYKEKLKAKEQRESNISSEPIYFATLVEEAREGLEDVTVTNEDEQQAQDLGGGLTKRQFDFSVNNVTLESLTKFLAALESKPGRIILTERLDIRSGSASEDRLTVKVTLSTWERRKADAPAEEEGEDKP